MLPPGYYGTELDDQNRGIAWLGEQTANDSRFAEGAIKFWFPALIGEELIHDELSERQLQQRMQDMHTWAQGFQPDQNLKQLLADILMSPWYRAKRVVSNDSEVIYFTGGKRLLTGEELTAKYQSLTGLPIEIFTGEFYDLYGGIDSLLSVERVRAITPMMHKVLERAAFQNACLIVLNEWNSTADERALFAAETEFQGQLFINLLADGGWDITNFCDPKINQPGEAIINNWSTDHDVQQAGNIPYAPFADHQSFFDKHHQKMMVINGINFNSINHRPAREYVATGTRRSSPSIAALFAAKNGANHSMPWLVDSMSTTWERGVIGRTAMSGSGVHSLITPERQAVDSELVSIFAREAELVRSHVAQRNSVVGKTDEGLNAYKLDPVTLQPNNNCEQITIANLTVAIREYFGVNTEAVQKQFPLGENNIRIFG
ncbi:hypothetical protein [Salinibius halmophilus]|uniref:hypothetical protein n=1 Tax=Salinibius halmophilus TaxID=1853216 RepID=UPI000E6622E3|nr:hypothetical protein [Salinibius halmophilus]